MCGPATVVPVQNVARVQVLHTNQELPHQQPDVMCCEGLLEPIQISPGETERGNSGVAEKKVEGNIELPR